MTDGHLSISNVDDDETKTLDSHSDAASASALTISVVCASTEGDDYAVDDDLSAVTHLSPVYSECSLEESSTLTHSQIWSSLAADTRHKAQTIAGIMAETYTNTSDELLRYIVYESLGESKRTGADMNDTTILNGDGAMWGLGVFETLRAQESSDNVDISVRKGVFKCRKCKSEECVFTTAQTRSCDEPATIFVMCTRCKNRWRMG